MVYAVMACIVMTLRDRTSGLYSYGVYIYGVHIYGVYSYGVYSYGVYSDGVYSYGLCSYGSARQNVWTHDGSSDDADGGTDPFAALFGVKPSATPPPAAAAADGVEVAIISYY